MIALREIASVPELMAWRGEVIANVFGEEPDGALLQSNSRYYERNVAVGAHIAFVASCDGCDCGCGAICFAEELPSPDNPTGLCAYLMNIYVRAEYRGRGVATNIVRHLISVAESRGCGKIYLETTTEGRPLYQSLGFRDMPDMMKYDGNL